jgi:Tol biopolymer transport system component
LAAAAGEAVTLVSGTKLGPYEIVSPLGAGGMGEVYRARDTRLGRDVAIKVLPQHLSANPEVRARFEREAKTVSALHHPNICTLFDVGREGETDYLVMELVEGETLSQRLTRGPLAPAEVLKLGAQIADALDRAHRAGVIHRDLKPGNVMVTKNGAKLMDFGLARATGLAGPASGVTVLAMTQSPTMAAPLTAEGTIVGTFQYMSPEQLEGKESDARSDLWALGCVLYEMTTGKRAFDGASQASLIGAIMHTEPAPMTALAPMSPPALERVVRQCLAKDPDERWQSAGDVRRELEWIATGSASVSGVAAAATVSAPMRASGARLAWTVAAVLATALVTLAVITLRAPRETAMNLHVAITPPEGATVLDDNSNAFVSPDGSAVVFLAADSTGVSQLWLRELSEATAHPLPGTQQGTLPFWSPDCGFIGFFADGKLKKVDRGGRNVQVLCDAPDGRGGAWNRRGVIVFAPASNGPLMQVADGGGEATVLLTPDSTRKERGMRFPQFLPDGDHFLYVTLSPDSLATRMGSLSSRDTRWIITAEAKAVYAPPHYLLYMRSGAILAQRFDRGSLRRSDRPEVVAAAAEGGQYTGCPTFSVSDNGVLVQRHRSNASRQFAWLDREGRRLGVVPVPAADYNYAELSPDDRSVATCIGTSSDGSADVWTIDLNRALSTRLTSDFPFCERPIWSPDGKWVIFSVLAREGRMLVRRLASGAGPADTVWAGTTPFSQATSCAPDGRSIVIRDLDPRTGEDLWILALEGHRERRPLLVSSAHEEDGIVSPDSRWLAFRSTESGRSELYVQSYPTAEAKLRVSTDGAGQPRSPFGRAFWRRDGRELVYVGGDGVSVMSAAFDPKGGPHVSAPLPLFRIPSGCQELVATSDLKRFLILEDRATKESGSVQMIVNWPAILERH